MLDQTHAAEKEFHTIDLDNGNRLSLVRRNPYGHIYLKLNKGNIPEKFSGAYTTVERALEASQKYQSERTEAKKELKVKNA